MNVIPIEYDRSASPLLILKSPNYCEGDSGCVLSPLSVTYDVDYDYGGDQITVTKIENFSPQQSNSNTVNDNSCSESEKYYKEILSHCERRSLNMLCNKAKDSLTLEGYSNGVEFEMNCVNGSEECLLRDNNEGAKMVTFNDNVEVISDVSDSLTDDYSYGNEEDDEFVGEREFRLSIKTICAIFSFSVSIF